MKLARVPKRNALVNILRGNVVREVSDLLSEEIDLIVYAGRGAAGPRSVGFLVPKQD